MKHIRSQEKSMHCDKKYALATTPVITSNKDKCYSYVTL